MSVFQHLGWKRPDPEARLVVRFADEQQIVTNEERAYIELHLPLTEPERLELMKQLALVDAPTLLHLNR
jgi:hypothetical protein